LDRYLKERIKQRLIHRKYKSNFEQYHVDKEQDGKELKGHEQSLCEKCKSLGRYCAEDLN
jgi:hypothetical protein